MRTTGEAQELSIVAGILVQGVRVTFRDTPGVINEPDEAVSQLLEGKATFVAPRIVDTVSKTIRMVTAGKH